MPIETTARKPITRKVTGHEQVHRQNLPSCSGHCNGLGTFGLCPLPIRPRLRIRPRHPAIWPRLSSTNGCRSIRLPIIRHRCCQWPSSCKPVDPDAIRPAGLGGTSYGNTNDDLTLLRYQISAVAVRGSCKES